MADFLAIQPLLVAISPRQGDVADRHRGEVDVAGLEVEPDSVDSEVNSGMWMGHHEGASVGVAFHQCGFLVSGS